MFMEVVIICYYIVPSDVGNTPPGYNAGFLPFGQNTIKPKGLSGTSITSSSDTQFDVHFFPMEHLNGLCFNHS